MRSRSTRYSGLWDSAGDEARLRERDIAFRAARIVAQSDLRQAVDAFLDDQQVLEGRERLDVVAVVACDQFGPVAGL